MVNWTGTERRVGRGRAASQMLIVSARLFSKGHGRTGVFVYAGSSVWQCRAMSQIAEFVNHGANFITPAIVENLLRNLPLWKVEFTQINAPQFPHLIDQLEFLADAVEDFADGAYKDLPYCACAQAVFALTYVHKKINIIPDTVPELGMADDSSVVRAVLIQNEKAFGKYAQSQGLSWSRITSRP